MPSVVLVHGYSETSLGAYHNIPALLNQSGFDTVVLSAFNSLDDFVTLDDLAAALELRVQDLEASGFNVRDSAFVCHSTGALITRRWILNRCAAAGTPQNATVPSRLVTMAGANHGSSLAEMGKTPLGYLEKLLLKHVLAVGKAVLTDLEYGSDFIRRLNTEWMQAWNNAADPLWQRVLSFSMGGDFIGNNSAVNLFWASCESGSDNTVRVSGANLNYTILEANPNDNPPKIVPTVLAQRAPHLILHGYSHFDTDTGILSAATTADAAFAALLTALKTEVASYPALADTWATANAAWTTANPTLANSTVVFDLRNQFGVSIDDCMIAFWDEADIQGDPRDIQLAAQRTALPDYVPPAAETPEEQAIRESVITASLSSSDAILPHSPIHNDVARGSYSFYLNYPTWVGDGTRHHAVYIEAVSDSPFILYQPTIYRPSVDINRLIQPNQFTYANVTLNRNPDSEYALYRWAPTLTAQLLEAAVWPPFPDLPGRVPPHPSP